MFKACNAKGVETCESYFKPAEVEQKIKIFDINENYCIKDAVATETTWLGEYGIFRDNSHEFRLISCKEEGHYKIYNCEKDKFFKVNNEKKLILDFKYIKRF